jgi:type IV pilus assembly protein PilQ
MRKIIEPRESSSQSTKPIEIAQSYMKIENAFALVAVFLATSLAAVAQTGPPNTSPVVTPSVPPLVEAEPTATNEPSGDEVVELVKFDDVPLPEAVRTLALQAGLNIQFDPRLLNGVTADGHPVAVPSVTEKWHHVTAMQALTALLENWGWQLVWDPRTKIARVTAKDPTALEPLVVTVIELKYSNPTNIIIEVQPTLSVRSTIIGDPRTHQLIVRTTEKELPGVEALVAKLDSATRQVLIEAKIIETTKDITSAKGVDWTGTLAAQHVSFGNGNTGGTLQNYNQSGFAPPTSTSTTSPGGSPITGTSGGGITSVFTNTTSLLTTVTGSPSSGGGFSLSTAHGLSPATAFLNADGVQAVLSFLNTDADTKLISFPRTVALDGVPTELMVVQNFPIFEQQQSAPAAGAASGLATVKPNYDVKVEGTVLNEVGVKLAVTPRIAGPTNVLMELRPEISQKDTLEATDTLNGQVSTSPIFDRRRMVTQAAVPSGYTLVMGGLDSDSVTKNFTKVPILGDLPGLGNLFRSDSKSHSRDTILLFVTPTIIEDVDFQPANTQFLKSKSMSPSTVSDSAWDSGEPYDWTKPKPTVAPAYQP